MSADVAGLRVRRQGLRIAAAVSVGFAWAVLAGAVLPFLGPFFAIQLLLSPRPPRMGQAIGLAVVVVGSSIVMLVLTGVLREQPPALVAVLALVYFVCFFLQAAGRGGGAPFLVLVVAIIVPMLGILQKDLGQSITVILANGIVAGLLLTWAAHAAFRDPGELPPPPPPPPHPGAGSVRRAAGNAAILLLMVCYCLTNGAMSSAVVVPITVASLLGQLDLAKRPVAVIGLMVVNLLGGVVASLAFAIYELWPAPLWLFLIVLVVGLLFGGKAAADRAATRTYAGGLSIFCILFGLGVSPLPSSTPESFSTRVGFILFAIVYTVTMASLIWRPSDAEPSPVGRGVHAP